MCTFYKQVFILLIVHCSKSANGALSDYINQIGGFFTFQPPQEAADNNVEYQQHVPYEVSVADEKFISEAAKLTGVALSELDSCQQRVVLKLQVDCHKMNDEQVAKMAVHLLNCQSYVEGRPMYQCTEEMSIKDCTTNMDSDTWTSYHLMSNRARAVCYSIRQIQFRGLAELTVNRLMDMSQHQLKTLQKILNNQDDLQGMAETTLDTLTQGHKVLSQQQKDLQQAQFHGQLAMEDNIARLLKEKQLILEAHDHLVQMTKKIQNKLEDSSKQLEVQMGENRLNHEELLDDLVAIQNKAQIIFQRIEDSSQILLKQNDDLKKQYASTLKNLAEVNATVHSLVTLVGGTRQALEERLVWLTTALGGTDMAVERLYIILWHAALMMVAMLTCAFLSARTSTRLVVAVLPPINLAVALMVLRSPTMNGTEGEEGSGSLNENLDQKHHYLMIKHLGPVELIVTILAFVIGQTLLLSALALRKPTSGAISWNKLKAETEEIAEVDCDENTRLDSRSTPPRSSPFRRETTSNVDQSVSTSTSKTFLLARPSRGLSSSDVGSQEEGESEDDVFNETYGSPTPPLSRSDFYNSSSYRARSRSNTPMHLNGIAGVKRKCHANTRQGTPCKLSTLPGRDYCYRHQAGDSVIG